MDQPHGSSHRIDDLASSWPLPLQVAPGDADGGEDPSAAYLEFSQPVTELYSELYNIPSGLVFWRGRVDLASEKLQIVEGTAISEASKEPVSLMLSPGALLDRLRGAAFQREGTFTATLAADEAVLPQPVAIELITEAAARAPDPATLPTTEVGVDAPLPPSMTSPSGSPKRARKKSVVDPTKGFGAGGEPASS